MSIETENAIKENLKIELSEPKMDFDIALNNLNLFVGQNSSGKSFILCTRAITQLLMLLTKSITVSSSTNPILFKGIEDILNRTYDPPITGKITLYNSESEFSYEVDNNKVIDVVLNDSKQSFSTYAPPIYLSTRTRLISNLNGYLKIAAKSKTEEELFDNCRDFLNLKYLDILFYLTFKIQIINLSSNKIIKSKILQEVNDQNVIQEALNTENKGKEITDIVIKDNKLIISIDNVEYNPSSFGNGFQSILTMILSTLFSKHNKILMKL